MFKCGLHETHEDRLRALRGTLVFRMELDGDEAKAGSFVLIISIIFSNEVRWGLDL